MKKKSIKVNMILNIAKQISSLIFPMITFPYITRVLHADNYGRYSYSFVIVNYFALLATYGVNSYAIREGSQRRNNKKELNIFVNQVFTFNLVTTFISYLLLFILIYYTPKLYLYKECIIILSITIIFTTLGTDWINSIFEDYLYLTIRYLTFQIIGFVCMILFVSNKEDYIIYAFITVCISVAANILNFFHIKQYLKIRITKINFKKHFAPMSIFFLSSLAIIVFVNSDITMIGIMKNDIEVGIYNLSVKIYSIVKQGFNAIIVVIIPRLSYYIGIKKYKDYELLCVKVWKIILALVLPCTTGIAVLSTNIIEIIGGKEYIQGSLSLKILSFALIFSTFGMFYSGTVLVPNHDEKYCLIATCISAVVNILLNIMFIPILGITGAAITTLISEFISFYIQYHYSRRYFKVRDKMVDLITPSIIACLIIWMYCIIVNYFFSNVIISTSLSIVISVLIYVTILYISKNETLLYIISNIKNKIIKLKVKNYR